jgi:hypothetical protein
MKEIIIFCQAPFDIAYCLSLYLEYKDDADISIYVINVKGTFEFLESLNLKLKNLIFIPYKKYLSIKNPFLLLKEKKRIKKLYNIHFKHITNANVYFFYRVFDWITTNYVAKLSSNNKVFFVGNDNPQDKPFKVIKNNLIHNINLCCIRYITEIKNYRYIKIDFGIMLDFNYVDKFNIERISMSINKNIYNIYRYNKLNIKKPAILFFENNPIVDYDFYTNYISELNNIINIIKQKNINIYIKPHPRTGYTNSISNKITDVIPAYVPGEFINFDLFQLIIGIETTTIAHIANTNTDKTYCLLNLFSFKKYETKDYFKKLLDELSENKLKFIQNFDELKKIISDI